MTTWIGFEYNTFSIMGRCLRTGMLGAAVTTTDISVGGRCTFAKAMVGATATQATTDPRLGPFALRLMELGYSAAGALQQIEASDPHIELRQLGLVDQDGNAAARTGGLNMSWAGHITGTNFVAMGNGLVGEGVVQAMASTFEETEPDHLEERLLRAMEAGQAAGGEARDATPYHSAGLLVYSSQSFPRVDLKVDEHATPLVELRRILELYKPSIKYFDARAADPVGAPALRKLPD
jgi:uncharacterized Ntn-hydrolase superfamily protein